MKDFVTLPIFGVFITLFAFYIAKSLRKKVQTVWLNPVMITVILIISCLKVFKIDYASYNEGGKFISFFLGPSIVALGVLFYQEFEQVKKNIFPFLTAVALGGILSMVSVVFILLLLHAPDFLIVSLAPKSVTTPIAIEISKIMGGVPSITAGIVILVGIFGNAFGPEILRFFGIKSKTALGTALGTTSHGIGTARAYEESETSGIYSGLAMCVNGIITAVVTPFFIEWLL